MQIIVEKIEENFIVVELENKKMIDLPRELFLDVLEGDVYNLIKDEEETKKRKEKITNLMDDLFI